jgi:hypothetical protein
MVFFDGLERRKSTFRIESSNFLIQDAEKVEVFKSERKSSESSFSPGGKK